MIEETLKAKVEEINKKRRMPKEDKGMDRRL